MASADSVAAIATAPGRGAVGVVRVSGRMASAIAQAITGKVLPERVATYAEFRDADGVVVDAGLALWFPAPRSFTGEDVLELQGHGGPAVLATLLERCMALGARMARPGEFTERAFLNGKLDLAQAESVADLIEATSAIAARAAMRSLRGEFSQRIEELAYALVDLRIVVESSLDFPEEGIDAQGATAEVLAQIREHLRLVQEAARQGHLLREGVQVAISGSPNVGKSSLLNRLVGEDLAIVTDIPGTTRDTLRASIELEGIPFNLVDTAGLRSTDDPVERIGVARAQAAAAEADVVLQVVDVGIAEAMRPCPNGRLIVVENKIDLYGIPPGLRHQGGAPIVRLSAMTGSGLSCLRAALLEAAGWTPPQPEGVYAARARHLEALVRASQALERAAAFGVDQADLLAEELRYAHDSLGAIIGKMSPDELLGEIFSRFCIGK
ncbi:MAG: tRNA uridine-5-carboxymethylaminomethyl(34) synthesis GTPase MnmE [Betaproteobacteria bacterium]